nr:dihydrodipicolinate synthase 1 [Tanacetum cinerariifolium]
MRSYEVKNRTSTDEIKSLRLITTIKTPYLPDGRFDLEAYDSLVIGNTRSNSTREAVHATEQGFAVGMHAALHIMPYYGKTSLEVWGGNDDECHYSKWDHDATGVISVTSNLVPGLMRELLSKGKNQSLNKKVLPLINWHFGKPKPIGVNTALAQLGVIRPIFRLPYVLTGSKDNQTHNKNTNLLAWKTPKRVKTTGHLVPLKSTI